MTRRGTNRRPRRRPKALYRVVDGVLQSYRVVGASPKTWVIQVQGPNQEKAWTLRVHKGGSLYHRSPLIAIRREMDRLQQEKRDIEVRVQVLKHQIDRLATQYQDLSDLRRKGRGPSPGPSLMPSS